MLLTEKQARERAILASWNNPGTIYSVGTICNGESLAWFCCAPEWVDSEEFEAFDAVVEGEYFEGQAI